MRTPPPNASPLWAYALCCALIGVSFGAFVFSLGSYPEPFVDDTFFSYPAVRFLEGGPLAYPMMARAPHANTVWAYHGPFFPRLQVLTLAVLPVSEFSFRLPQDLAAHLGLLVLCVALLRWGLFRSAIVLAVCWLGDRASQEVLVGRPDGFGLLFLGLGFVCLVRLTEGLRPRWAAGAGLALGAAVGFNPTTLVFPLGTLAVLALLVPRGSRLRTLGAFVAGGLVPAAVVLACWLPRVSDSVEQFLWHARAIESRAFFPKLGHLLRYLTWARYWFIGLCLVALLLVPAVGAFFRSNRGLASLPRRQAAWVWAGVFSVLGLVCVGGSSALPCYLVFFTVWPVLALAVLWETASVPKRLVPAFVCLCLLLLGTWVPSLAWNLLRAREAFLYARELDRGALGDRLAAIIPAGVRVTGSPEFFATARQAQLHFTPLPWHPERLRVPRNTWVVLTERDWVNPARARLTAKEVAARPVVARAACFPGARYMEGGFVVLGPASEPARPAP